MKKFLTIFSHRRCSPGSSTGWRPWCKLGATAPCSTIQLPKYEAYGKIHKAASVGDVAKVLSRLQLEKNGSNDRDKNNRTPLHYACAHGHPDVVTLLIDWNCNIDLRDSDNSTPLIKASQNEHEECLAILLEHGAFPNAVDKSGNTALHYAVYTENILMATKLLEYSADANIMNKGGVSPRMLAQLGSNEDLIKLLVSQLTNTQEVSERDRKSSGSNSCSSSSPKEAKDKFQELLQPLTEASRSEGKRKLHRFGNPKLKVKTKRKAEKAVQRQQTLADTSVVTEKTKKHDVNKVEESGAVASVLRIQDEKAEDQQITVESQVNDGSVMKTSEVKKKVKGKVRSMIDPNKSVRPHERNSEDRDMLSLDEILSLIEQLMRQNKDSRSLMKISHAVHTYKKSLQLKTHNFELLKEKYKNVKNNLSASQKKASKIVKEKSRVDTENTKLKAEIHNLRLKLENPNLQLTTKQEAEEAEKIQGTQDMKGRKTELEKEIRRLKLDYSNLQATTKQQAEEAEKIQRTQSELIEIMTHGLETGKRRNSELKNQITRLKHQISDLQGTGKHKAEETEQIQTAQNDLIQSLKHNLEDGKRRHIELEKEICRLNLENLSLQATIKYQTEESKQLWKIQSEFVQTLTQSLEDGNKRNIQLEKEITRLELEILNSQATTKQQAEEAEKIQRTQTSALLMRQNELIQSLSYTFEERNRRKSQLEKEKNTFKKQSDECENGEPESCDASSPIHWEKKQAVLDEYKEQVMRMKQIIKDMQKEIQEVKSHENSTNTALEMYKQLYKAELDTREELQEKNTI